jgi:hypothetical protein
VNDEGAPYDSSVDSMSRPTLFILHDNNNVYPRFLITYKVLEVQLLENM